MNTADKILFNQKPRAARALHKKLYDGLDAGEQVTLAIDGKSATYKFADGSFATAQIDAGTVRWSGHRYPKA